MARKGAQGLFITGVDTEVGKTYVAARIVESLCARRLRVGVYKPAASGCRRVGDELVSDDAEILWTAAGRPADLQAVCPQRFAAPLAPHLAARLEGRRIDVPLLHHGLDHWRTCSDVLIVEGVGGLLSPIAEDQYVADLARDFGLPLIVVAANRLGVINQTLQTLVTAAAYDDGLAIAGVVLNDADPPDREDPSRSGNRQELEARCVPPVLAHLGHGASQFDDHVDWLALARG
jgi:dethiobiotin synthetase